MLEAQGDGQGQQHAGVSLSKTAGPAADPGAGSAGATAPPFDADAT